MPKRAKKRKRLNLPWNTLIWVGLLANIAAGVYTSKLTMIRKLRVEGASIEDRARITKLAQSIRGKPALQINTSALESLIAESPAISSVDFSRNIFGRGLLKITYRNPVARIAGEDALYLSDSGVVYQLPKATSGLPIVQLPPAALAASPAILGSWPCRPVAYLCQQLRRRFDKLSWTIVVDPKGVLNLKAGNSATIELGDASKLDEKLQALQELLDDRPGLLSQVKSVVLVLPSQPMLVPK